MLVVREGLRRHIPNINNRDRFGCCHTVSGIRGGNFCQRVLAERKIVNAGLRTGAERKPSVRVSRAGINGRSVFINVHIAYTGDHGTRSINGIAVFVLDRFGGF